MDWYNEFASPPAQRNDRLGNYLITRGILDRFDLNWALRESEKRSKPLGEMLVELELASPLQIQQALDHQRILQDKKAKQYK